MSKTEKVSCLGYHKFLLPKLAKLLFSGMVTGRKILHSGYRSTF